MTTILAINESTTSVGTLQDLLFTYEGTLENLQFAVNHFLMILQMIGIVANALVFLVARRMVKVEKKRG